MKCPTRLVGRKIKNLWTSRSIKPCLPFTFNNCRASFSTISIKNIGEKIHFLISENYPILCNAMLFINLASLIMCENYLKLKAYSIPTRCTLDKFDYGCSNLHFLLRIRNCYSYTFSTFSLLFLWCIIK